MKKRKPKILLIPDFKNWAYDIRANYLMEYLGEYFEFDKLIGEDLKNISTVKRQDIVDWGSYDLVFVFYWKFFRDIGFYPSCRAMATGVFSHDSWQDEKAGLVEELKKYKAVGVNTKILLDELGPIHKNLFYLPNGIEDKKFYPKFYPKNKIFTVGWVGYPDRGGEDDRKGFYTVISPALEKFDDIEFLTSKRGMSELVHEQMPDFYNKLDVYVCASSSEGFCNPVVEAMACGIPVISTKVGISKQIIKNGKNGLFIERSPKDLFEAINKLKNNQILRKSISKNARKTALKFAYGKISNVHRKFFDFCLR